MRHLATDSSIKLNWSQWALRLIGLALLGVIAMKVGKNALLYEISSTRWPFVVVAAALSAGHFCMKAGRWHYILHQRGVSVSHSRTIIAYCAGALIGALTPGRIGELSKVAFVRMWRKDCSWGTAFGTVVLDRIADVTVLILVATAGTIWFVLPGGLRLAGGMVAVLFLASGTVVGVFVWKQSNSSLVGGKVAETLRHKLGAGGKDFWVTLKVGTGRSACLIVLWTSLAYVLFFAHFVFLGRAVGSEISLAVLGWAIAIASLGAILPISISGIGVRDYILVQVFTAWKETSARALAVSLLYLGVFNVVVAAMGIWPFLAGDIDFKTIQKGESE